VRKDSNVFQQQHQQQLGGTAVEVIAFAALTDAGEVSLIVCADI
jgi:hypothetical protein